MDDCASTRQKLLDRLAPNSEAVELNEAADFGYGLFASDGIVWASVREHYQDFPGFWLPAKLLGSPEQCLRQGRAARRFEQEVFVEGFPMFEYGSDAVRLALSREGRDAKVDAGHSLQCRSNGETALPGTPDWLAGHAAAAVD